MKTLIVAVTCLGIGVGIGHAENIKEELGSLFKTPSRSETQKELQSNIDRMDTQGLHTTLIDYAHRAKLLQIQVDKNRKRRLKTTRIISELRADLKACESQ